jgi:hypothetical protein
MRLRAMMNGFYSRLDETSGAGRDLENIISKKNVISNRSKKSRFRLGAPSTFRLLATN